MAAGIREVVPEHLFSAHSAPENSGVDQYSPIGLDINSTYTYGIVHKMLLHDYDRRIRMPFVLMESTYEGEHNASPVQIRRQAYWAILCGATGQFLGNKPLWEFDPGWEQSLESQGAKDMEHLRALFLSRPWWELVPDQEHRIVTGGLGEFNGLDTLTAAATRDGRTLIAYIPSTRKITVDPARLIGERFRAWWFDPRSGTARDAGTVARASVHEFQTPGEGDWVLVMDDEASRLPAPGAR